MSTGVTIYALYIEDDKGIRYIGQTKQSLRLRLKNHINAAKNKTKHTPIGKWINSKLKQGFNIKIKTIKSNAKWNIDEILYIKEYKELKHKLLNCTNGGQGHYGTPLSDDVKKKISSSLMGKKKSESHCKNISRGRNGIEILPNSIEKMKEKLIGRSPVNKGIPMGSEQKQLISISKGSKPFNVYCKYTNKLIGTWVNKAKCCRDLGLHPFGLQQVLNNEYSYTKDFRCEYIRGDV